MIPALGHDYVEGVCSRCGAEEIIYVVINTPAVGTAYKFGMIQENVSATDVYYLTGAMDGYYMATTTNKDLAADIYLEETTGGYYLYTMIDGTKTYINMVVNGNYVNGAYEAAASTVYTFDTTSRTIVSEIDGTTYWFGTRNDKTYTTVGPCDVSYNGFYCQFYGEAVETPEPECEHANTTTEGATEATCTEAGHTGKTVCSDCGETVNEGSVIPALGHNYVEGVCTNCGETEPTTEPEPEIDGVTIDLTTKDNRTVYTANQQVWEQNGITVTNDKAASTTNVGDYAPARFYKSSKLTVAYPGMTRIVFNCNDYKSEYAAVLAESIGTVEGVTVTVDDNIVTVEFAAARNSFVIEKLTAQVRMDSITVVASSAEAPCEHANTTIEGATEATCTEAGHTGKTVCVDCGATVNEGSVIPALGHNYVDGVCTNCGEAEITPEPEPEPEPKVYLVSYSLNGHGKTMPSQRVTEGNKAVRPADPTAEGYIFGGWYLDSACTIPFDFSAVITESIVIYAKWTKIENPDVDSSEVFEDLKEESWYYDAVDFMVDKGLMNGVSENEFAPEEKLSRAMMWTILARLDGVDTENGATWYEKGRDWAMEAGISDGADPNSEITREQLVVMLWRFMGQPKANGDLSAYADADSVSVWAQEAMAWAIETGLINGVTPTALEPGSNATRAQVATILWRFCENILKD